jgi:ubiquinone/menaquinone biosynthesis C-methylase UbiE
LIKCSIFADDPKALFEEAIRVLKRGGKLLVVAFTFTQHENPKSQPVPVSVDVKSIMSWLMSENLEIEQIDKIPGESLDISLILARKIG